MHLDDQFSLQPVGVDLESALTGDELDRRASTRRRNDAELEPELKELRKDATLHCAKQSIRSIHAPIMLQPDRHLLPGQDRVCDNRSMNDILGAKQLLLRTFRWTQGHADFADSLRDPELLAAVGPALARPFVTAGVTAVVALEARGFVLGALAARELAVGLILARKPGAIHPDSHRLLADTPDWRGRQLEL